MRGLSLALAVLLLTGCTDTLFVAHDPQTGAETARLESTRLFQASKIHFEPATGAFDYNSDPQGQQATDLVKATTDAVLKGVAKGAAGGVGVP